MGCCCALLNEESQPLNPSQPPVVVREEPRFDRPYLFKMRNIVVIRHNQGSHIRVEGNSLSAHGGKGRFAQFEIEPFDGGNKCKIKSCHSGKYIRIHGNRVDCTGLYIF